MLVDGDWIVIHTWKFESYFNWITLRWQLGGLVEAPGVPSVVYFWKSRSTRVIILWNATQAQRNHKIIHARNFHVQPQAIMGSGIVE